MDEQSKSDLAALVNGRFSERAAKLRDAFEQALGALDVSELVNTDELSPFSTAPAAAASSSASELLSLQRWVASIDEDRSQVNILKSLLEGTRDYAQRACIFVLRNDNLTGWAAAGFSGNGNASDEQAKATALPLARETLLRQAVNSATLAIGAPDDHSQNDALLTPLGGLQPSQMAAFPLLNKGRIAAVLYADSGTAPGLGSTAAIEILARVATMSIELIPVRGSRPAQAAAAQPATAQPAAAQPAAAQPAAAQPVAAQPAAAQPATAIESPPAAATPVPTAVAVDLSSLAPDVAKLHETAKRKARVLVSDLILYNQGKIDQARSGGDIYAVLKDDIDRSVDEYNRKVDPSVAEGTDYFYEEMVKTLAEGNRALLSSFRP